MEPETVAAEMTFITSTGQQIFLEIAKLRALRLLWNQVLTACGIEHPVQPWIHAAVLRRSLPAREPSLNLLRCTDSSLASILGGADSLETPRYDSESPDPDSDRGRRLARNTQLILGLEAGNGAGGTVSCSDGRPLSGRAAYMAQRDLLFPWLSVLDNVTLGCRLRRDADPSSSRERAMALLKSIGLATNGADLPDSLSGGMRQRAALARTLMEDRPVVLMDEPFSAVDAITRVRLQNLAARLLGGRTVLLVTHDPLEALRLGHRIHVMSGRPAILDDALEPPGTPPRDVDDPRILELQGDLLRRLAEAAL